MVSRMRRGHAISRRTFLALTGGVLPLARATTAQGRRKTVPVGLELYSVRTEYTRDLAGTVTAVAKMGYELVEFWAPYFDWTVTQAKDVRRLLDDLGIKCHSTHNNGDRFTPEGLGKAIELNQIIGSRYIIQASAPRGSGQRGARSIDDWKALSEKLTSFAEQLRPLGMATGYHNHQEEWRVLEGQRPMDLIAANTPKDVVLQFDVGTCVEVGADPIAWINANPGRIKSVHCKDWGAGQGRGYSVAFGEGDAPWLKIFEAVESAGGIEYYLIEQEVSPPGQQLAMAEKCLANWKKLRA
jgi:sugar phosphate isomerase/epimerase